MTIETPGILSPKREFIMLSKKTKTPKTDEFVPVLFADSLEEAEEYSQLLEDHGIKGLVDLEQDGKNLIADNKVDETDETDTDDISHGVPIFVHKSDVAEANEIISEHDDLEVFALGEDELSDDDEDDDFGMGPDTGNDDDLRSLEEDSLEEMK